MTWDGNGSSVDVDITLHELTMALDNNGYTA